MLKSISATVAIIIAIIALIAASDFTPARAQNAPQAPTGITVANGAEPGQVVVSWQGGANARFYRIGWVAFDDIDTARDDGREWLDAFAFQDVSNHGQTNHTIKNLKPGTQYAFITASLLSRFGNPTWSRWAYLTTAAPPNPNSSGTANPAATATRHDADAPAHGNADSVHIQQRLRCRQRRFD